MPPIKVPTTVDELRAVAREWDAAHYYANASEDPDVVKRANDRIIECERAFDAAAFTLDEDGITPIPKNQNV